MAPKPIVRDITLVEKSGITRLVSRKPTTKEDIDTESLNLLKRVISPEKIRLLHMVKSKKPKSLYALAKLLERDFKSVMNDVKLLENFGFIEMSSEKTGDRERLRPMVVANQIQINVHI